MLVVARPREPSAPGASSCPAPGRPVVRESTGPVRLCRPRRPAGGRPERTGTRAEGTREAVPAATAGRRSARADGHAG
jgi:hypothetical protein